MKKIFLFSLIIATVFASSTAFAKVAKGYYYQIKIYHFRTKAQEAQLDSYLQNAYLPAMHRAGIKSVGVFKPIVQDTTDQLIYVFTPFLKFDQFLTLDEKLKNDSQYLTASKDYNEAAYNASPYSRIESILLKAFSGMPAPAVPKLSSAKNERVYELRSYEGATEALSLNKINMFNVDELSIFTNLNFNPVFYGQVISGSKMPNLMYMTTFNNKADRDKHWADFTPEYRKISGKPEYARNTSKNTMYFLYPADYSDY